MYMKNIQMDLNMKDKKKMDKDMVLVNIFMEMVVIMKENGKIIK